MIMLLLTNIQLKMSEDINYDKIIKNGTMYGENTMIVSCDRCKRANIKEYIGYQDHDICMKCVKEITETKKTDGLIIGSLFDTNGKNGSLLDSVSTAYHKQPPRGIDFRYSDTRMEQDCFR